MTVLVCSFFAALTLCLDRCTSSLPFFDRIPRNRTSRESSWGSLSPAPVFDPATLIRSLSSLTLEDARSSSAFSHAIRFESALSLASFSFRFASTALSSPFLSFVTSTFFFSAMAP